MGKEAPVLTKTNIMAVNGSKTVAARRSPRPGPWRRTAGLIGPLALAATLLLLFGFVVFVERIGALQEPGGISQADGIVVLTGGKYRLEKSVALLAAGKGKRLLISGVHPALDKHSVLRAVTDNYNGIYDRVDVDHAALETVGNAAQTAKWVASNDFHSIILVTNNYHIPRSLLELERVTKNVEIRPYPVVNSDLTGGAWLLRADTVRVLFAEYLKYLGAKARAVLPVPASLSALLWTSNPK